MKKLTILFLVIFLGISVNAQKKTGTIFSENENIDKTKALWTALIDGDKKSFVSFFADSVLYFVNGVPNKYPKEGFGGFVDYWSGFENLEIKNDHQSTPVALDYKTMFFVQDWLVFSGIHTETGMNKDFHLHNLYSFDKDGKIVVVYAYYDPNFYEEITESSLTKENGKLFIQHPHIVTVRKMLNAYVAKDIDKWAEYFAPNATFKQSPNKVGVFTKLEEQKAAVKSFVAGLESIKFVQVGYPDCVYYEKDNYYSVYSYWTYKATTQDGKKLEFPLTLVHSFNKDGKITVEYSKYSSNHLE